MCLAENITCTDQACRRVLRTHGQVSLLADSIDITGYPQPTFSVEDWKFWCRYGAGFRGPGERGITTNNVDSVQLSKGVRAELRRNR